MKICYVKHYMRVRSLGVVYLGGSGSGTLMESYSSSCPGQHSSEGITTICGKFLKRGITDHLTCRLKNLYAGQEATARTRYRTTD